MAQESKKCVSCSGDGCDHCNYTGVVWVEVKEQEYTKPERETWQEREDRKKNIGPPDHEHGIF